MISDLLRHPRLQVPLRVAAGASWLASMLVSLAEGGAVDRGLSFGCAALVTRLAFRHTKSRWQLGAFAAAAALLQVGEGAVPALSGRVEGWLAASAGAFVGIVIARTVDHLSWRPRAET